MKKSCIGMVLPQAIGDGLICLTLAYNLSLMGYEVVVFHNALVSMDEWFPAFSIRKIEALKDVSQVDLFIVEHHLKNYLSVETVPVLYVGLRKFSLEETEKLNEEGEENLGVEEEVVL